MRRALLLMLLAGSAACAPRATAPDEKPAWNARRATQMQRYLVDVRFEPDPPAMGELFEVVAVVKGRDGAPVEDAKVKLDARMPQHGHGMETDPVDEPGVCDEAGACRHPGGVYRATGFKFHMGGDWTILMEIEGPYGHDNTSFVYDMAG